MKSLHDAGARMTTSNRSEVVELITEAQERELGFAP